MKEKITKLLNVHKKYGFIGFCKKLKSYIIANYLDKFSFTTLVHYNKYKKEIKEILKSNNYDRIILWRSSFGYKVHLFQRPQHIANNLANQKCLMFYEVTTMTDNIKVYEKLKDNFYLFNFNNILLNKILMNELKKNDKPKYIEVYSTDWKLSIKDINKYMNKGFKFIYEYIDHLSPELSGTLTLPTNITDKYNYAMSNTDVYVVVTADVLMNDVINKRGNKNLVYSSNGVDYKFFQEFSEHKLDYNFAEVFNNGKRNVCYYGALAKWFDYDLIKEIACSNKYNVILFGIKYDESYDQNITGKEENIYFFGPKDYSELKYYARNCDILMVPFLINDITKSTNPVKIFEYMALKKPIVTTDLNECKKYKSIFIGKNHSDFIKKLEESYFLRNDKNYLKLLDKEARENDWSKKAEAIINLVKKDEK